MRKEALIGTIAIFASLELSKWAFSYKTKQEIKERARKKLGYVGSEISGKTGHLEAAHIDHDRSNPDYDKAKNGFLCTTEEHLDDHITRAGENGLSERNNSWAIDAIQKRLAQQKRETWMNEPIDVTLFQYTGK